jgi:hypothetical protein
MLTAPKTTAPCPALQEITGLICPPGLQIVVWANKYRLLEKLPPPLHRIRAIFGPEVKHGLVAVPRR